ncbi:MAG TPA: undecaprenyl-diphosphate phosphatase [Candidatus Saccharimonadales bacterium]|nr:undecaprenyl-diphosphate phosphatase [Candidatus Saccharimonadales bacterium]
MITYLQAIIIGLLQGVTELFPISSLGHSVLLPTLFGWHGVVAAQSDTESYFLAFLVGLHVATAIALLIFYRQQWSRIISGFFSSLKTRKITTVDQRLAWLLVMATIPAALFGLIFEHRLRVIFAKPLAAAIFLIINGLILLLGDRLVKVGRHRRADFSLTQTTANLASLSFKDSLVIGTMQILALFAGISRSGITMVGGLWRGLDHEDAARFSFLLATPIILAAGLYKLPDLLGPNGNDVRGQILAGSLAAGLAAYLTVRFLDRFFQANRLKPFAIYCISFGLLMMLVIH